MNVGGAAGREPSMAKKAKNARKPKGPFLSAITGRFVSRATARRWPKTTISLSRRRRGR